jgi:hypothetical protein
MSEAQFLRRESGQLARQMSDASRIDASAAAESAQMGSSNSRVATGNGLTRAVRASPGATKEKPRHKGGVSLQSAISAFFLGTTPTHRALSSMQNFARRTAQER